MNLIGVVLFLAGFLVTTRGQKCTLLGNKWHLTEPSCPSGAIEMRTLVHKQAGQYMKECCTNMTEEQVRKQKNHRAGCKVSPCESSSVDNLCSTEPYHTYIDGKLLDLQEMFRDKCKTKGGKSGEVAYCCPKDSLEASLITTMGAEINEFPHQAKLKLPGNCGGTVYNKRYIVTAAHCIVDKETYQTNSPTKMKVVLGSNLADMEGDEYVYQVEEAIPHENYSKLLSSPQFDKDVTLNDIALLKLDRDIKFSNNVKALKIAPEDFDPFKCADHTVIVGWGTTDTLSISAHLQKANFILRSDRTCFGLEHGFHGPWWNYNEYKAQLLCVGGIIDGKWSPTAGGGDSGGPAICRDEEGKIVLCGVTSFGGSDEKCAAQNNEDTCLPSVYAEVSHFHKWIEAHAGPQDPKTFYRPSLYGEPVAKNKNNHQVHITSKTGKPCGGTLIAPDIVVTAAHCISNGKKRHSGLKVHYGVKDIRNGDSEQVLKVKAVKTLDSFKKSISVNLEAQKNRVIIADDYYQNDLGIIKLEEGAPIRESELPVLPGFEDKFSKGKEMAFPRNTTFTGRLLSRDYNILRFSDCQNRMDRASKIKLNGKIDANILCGVEKYSGGSLCDRELGGGLICQKGGKQVLCGVQVFRLCEWSIPNGFINMALYSNWVDDESKKL